MDDIHAATDVLRTAAGAFKARALRVPDSAWNASPKPGRWSPAQVVDHVGVSTRVAHDAILGRAHFFRLPKFVRPLAGALLFKRTLAKGLPKKSKGPAVMAPAVTPSPREQLIRRLDEEIESLAGAAQTLARSGITHFEHTVFGRLSVADYLRFNALHVDHHREQLAHE